MIPIPDDNDRIYFINMDWVRENVRRDPETLPPTFELVPTDDPNLYTMRVTAPMPKLYIKSARAHEWEELK